MSDDTLRRMLESYFSTKQPVYTFAWQGGEPTLMGLDFFRRVVELQRELAPPGAQITNAIQTNGTLITEEFARFLAEKKFLVGVSIDGPEEIHDRYRRGLSGAGGAGEADGGSLQPPAGGPTHWTVVRGLRTLQAAGAELNAVTVVNNINVHHASLLYEYIRDELGIRWHQYIPLVEWDQDGTLLPFSITGEQWGSFLNELFERWYPRDVRRVSVRFFDSVLQLLALGKVVQCTMGGRCDSYLVVEHNGEVYPCDFYVEPEWRLGMLSSAELSETRRTPGVSKFAAQKSRWPAECDGCPYLMLCSGDCPRMRRGSGVSHLCAGWKSFYDNHLEDLRGLAASVPDYNGGVDRIMRESDPEAPCFCGSGKRFANCHGREA
mgnify:CR=1 FL=1